jgi:hypothetical protein
VSAIRSRRASSFVTTLKEIERLDVEPSRLRRRLLAIPAAADLRGTRTEDYVRLGERSGVHRLVSLAARRSWYTALPPRGALLLPRRIGERMPVARSQGAAFDNNLFGITPRPGVPLEALQAALNATITRLEIELSARELTGAQAVADTNVYLVKTLPVPRADFCALGRRGRALAARRAPVGIHRGGTPDRRALDALVAPGLPEGCGGREEALQALVKRRSPGRMLRAPQGEGVGWKSTVFQGPGSFRRDVTPKNLAIPKLAYDGGFTEGELFLP